MSKPKIELENYEAVYEYYAQPKNSPRFSRFAYFLLKRAFMPDVDYAEAGQKKIDNIFERKGQVILAANHITAADQYVLAALAGREETLSPLYNQTFIVGKAAVFYNPAIRRAVDRLRAVPAFRVKEVTGTHDNKNFRNHENYNLQRTASEALKKVCISRYKNGEHMAIFPEGTRRPFESRELLPLQRGVGEIACAVSVDVDTSLLPVGISYKSRDLHDIRRPKVFIGEPLPGPFENPEAVIDLLQTELQHCADKAFEL